MLVIEVLMVQIRSRAQIQTKKTFSNYIKLSSNIKYQMAKESNDVISEQTMYPETAENRTMPKPVSKPRSTKQTKWHNESFLAVESQIENFRIGLANACHWYHQASNLAESCLDTR